MASGLRFAYEKTLALVGVCVNRIGMVWTKELAEANDYLFIPADKENQIPKAWLPLPTSSDPASVV